MRSIERAVLDETSTRRHDRKIGSITAVPPLRPRKGGWRSLSPGGWHEHVGWLSTGLCFTGVLAIVSLVDRTHSAETRQAWRAWASTNLENLQHHPVAAIAVSAFLHDGDTWVWIVLSLVGLAATGRVLGNTRTAILALAGHVLATLVSEGILACRIAVGAVTPRASHVLDVGPSYIVVCALVAAIGYSSWPGRLLSAAGFAVLAPYLFFGLHDWGVAETGHACAVVIGLALGYPLRVSRIRAASAIMASSPAEAP
jgi:hypothetical protein